MCVCYVLYGERCIPERAVQVSCILMLRLTFPEYVYNKRLYQTKPKLWSPGYVNARYINNVPYTTDIHVVHSMVSLLSHVAFKEHGMCIHISVYSYTFPEKKWDVLHPITTQ